MAECSFKVLDVIHVTPDVSLTYRDRPSPKEEQDELTRQHNEMYGRSHNGMRAAFE